MKHLVRVLAAGSISLLALSCGGCTEGGPGPRGTSSEQNVGSRSSHELYGATETGVPQPAPTAGAPTDNAADKAIDASHQPGGFGGTSQENAGSSTPGGITAAPGPAAGSGSTPAAQQPSQAGNGNSADQPGGTVPTNTGPGTTANGNVGFPNSGSNTNQAGQPAGTSNGTNNRTGNAAPTAQPAK